jgi:peptidoglycan/LPS O-acetylase OafA/YrhL
MTSQGLLNKRQPALDGLRTVAVAAVFVAHTDPRFPNGGLGVDVFFALSGFLITTIVIGDVDQEHQFSYRRFLLRRLMRLGPALLAVIAFSLLASLVLHGVIGPQSRRAAPFALFYVANWYRAFGGHAGLLAHTWSLGIEEQFYVAWPIILFVAFRRYGRRGVLWAAVVLAVASTLVRLGLSLDHASDARIYNGTDTEADQILWGCALAIARLEFPGALRRLSVAAIPALVLLIGMMALAEPQAFFFRGGYTLVSICSAVLISSLTLHQAGPLYSFLTLRPVVWLGRISYGIYLWHYPLSLIVRNHVHSVLGVMVVVGALSIAAAAMSFNLIEVPVLKWRERVVSDSVEAPTSLSTQDLGDRP